MPRGQNLEPTGHIKPANKPWWIQDSLKVNCLESHEMSDRNAPFEKSQVTKTADTFIQTEQWLLLWIRSFLHSPPPLPTAFYHACFTLFPLPGPCRVFDLCQTPQTLPYSPLGRIMLHGNRAPKLPNEFIWVSVKCFHTQLQNFASPLRSRIPSSLPPTGIRFPQGPGVTPSPLFLVTEALSPSA
jgi:hypothetical protein